MPQKKKNVLPKARATGKRVRIGSRRAAAMKMIQDNPKATGATISKLLAIEGIEVSGSWANTIRSQMIQAGLIDRLEKARPRRKFTRRQGAVITLAINHYPYATAKDLVRILARVGIVVNENDIGQRRTRLRQSKTALMKPVRVSRKGIRTEKVLAIEEAIRNDPEKTNAEIVEILRRKGIEVTARYVSDKRSLMRVSGEDLPYFSRRLRALPELTPKQEELKERFTDFVMSLAEKAGMRRRLTRTAMEDFMQEVALQFNYWVADHDAERYTEAQFRGFLAKKIDFTVKRFVKVEVKRALGITHEQTACLFRLLRSLRQRRSLKSLAEEEEIPLKEARELIALYNAMVKGRLGEYLKEREG